MKTVQLDLVPSREREELHAYLAEKLQLPSWYGANLDALYDCLTEIAEDTEIAVRYTESTVSRYEKRMFHVLSTRRRKTVI